MGGWRRSTACSLAIVAGLSYFLLLPEVGCMLDDDAIRNVILVLFYSQGLPDSIGSTSVLDVT